MPQQPSFILRDSTGLDTLWLDVSALPAKTYNPLDTPDVVLFDIDQAISHQIEWGQIDTALVHKFYAKKDETVTSFLKHPVTSKNDGIPELSNHPKVQMALSGVVLLIFFAGFSILFSTAKARLSYYMLSIFNNRKFKEYFAQETPGVLPPTPVLYLLQSIVAGSVIGVWLLWKTGAASTYDYIIRVLWIMLMYLLIPVLRNGFIMLLGNVFMIQHEARKHILISYLSHTLLFLLVLPVAIQLAVHLPYADAFVEEFFFVSVGLVLLYQLVKFIQNTPFPDYRALFYIFLYFCTLEILPLLVIYKSISMLT